MSKLPKNKIALIHVAKTQTGMTDDEYRDLLGSVGVKSSTELTNKTFAVVMDHFSKLGFRSKKGTKYRKVQTETDRKVQALLLDMGKEWSYADSIGKRMSSKRRGGPIERYQFLSNRLKEAVKVALIKEQEKRQNEKK